MSNIAYIRVSHTESLNGTSLETQERRCKAFAELHNFSIDKVYTEVVSGGVEFRKRPVFQKVLSELKANSKLVVSRLDRLSRKVIDTLKLVDDFKRERKEICITDIGNIHKDGVSKVFVTILASLAEIERENISTRIKASKKLAQEDRKYLGGYTEFGYKVENKKLVPDDKEFIVLQSMVNLRKSGLGYRKISDEIKNKFGKKIYYPQVHKILNRPHNKQLLQVA
jgi:site-specific DNA recombinase|tara:strand:+ start:369 stop:1043 length:675 start_codon:yes stop_codon:yes gene_type:complete